MKIFKNIIAYIFILTLVFACKTDEDFLYSFDEITAPVNISAVFDITQDNTGLVTIVPNADGAQTFKVAFGDGVEEIGLIPGMAVTHTYLEGVYQVGITAVGITGLTTKSILDLNVTFKSPENLKVVAENDPAVSNKVDFSATADYATVFEIFFGEATDEEPTTFLPGEVISHTYPNPGDYEVTIKAKSAAIATSDTTFTVTAVAVVSPVKAAPVPPVRNASDVVSIFSDSYTNITISEWNPGWGQTTTLTTEKIADNSTLKYSMLNYTGIVTDYGNPADLTGMTHVHFDYWTSDATSLALKLVNTTLDPISEDIEAVPSITKESWVSVDIPLSDFSADLSGITQMLFESSGATVFVDNFYFYTETPSAPIDAAPTPSINAANVISIFSNAYTDITVTEWNPGWGQTTTLSTVDIAGNSTLKYGALNFTGIVTDYNNPTDLSGMSFVHFDYWTNDATTLALKLVNTTIDPISEDIETVPSLTLGSWVSVDIPLSDFAADLSGITQMLFESSGATVYIDNFYFYKESASAPTAAPPTPTVNAADVISIFSDAYTNITVNEWNPGWGQTTALTTVDLGGNNVLKYEALNFTGIVTDYNNPTNLASKTKVHFDYWTSDATSLALKLVNTTLDPVSEDIETVSPITLGSWVSVDITLSDYSTDLSGVTQLLFESSGATVYIDNLYFY